MLKNGSADVDLSRTSVVDEVEPEKRTKYLKKKNISKSTFLYVSNSLDPDQMGQMGLSGMNQY